MKKQHLNDFLQILIFRWKEISHNILTPLRNPLKTYKSIQSYKKLDFNKIIM